MAIQHDKWGRTEADWVESLVQESSRDLVFLFNITQGATSWFQHTDAELPSVIERVVNRLVQSGCLVSFGAPDTPSWTGIPELNCPPQSWGSRIAELWSSNPDYYRFLVFALRPVQGSSTMPPNPAFERDSPEAGCPSISR